MLSINVLTFYFSSGSSINATGRPHPGGWEGGQSEWWSDGQNQPYNIHVHTYIHTLEVLSINMLIFYFSSGPSIDASGWPHSGRGEGGQSEWGSKGQNQLYNIHVHTYIHTLEVISINMLIFYFSSGPSINASGWPHPGGVGEGQSEWGSEGQNQPYNIHVHTYIHTLEVISINMLIFFFSSGPSINASEWPHPGGGEGSQSEWGSEGQNQPYNIHTCTYIHTYIGGDKH